MLGVAIGTTCECDSYNGHVCGKHERIQGIQTILDERGMNPLDKTTKNADLAPAYSNGERK